MQFSETSNYTGIIQAAEAYTDLGFGVISSNTDFLKRFTNYINIIGRQVAHDIFSVYNGWVYDDGENSDLPQGTTDIVSGTYRMALPSDSMAILRIEIKDDNGNWGIVEPYIIEQADGAIAEMNTEEGTPTHYRLTNGAIELYPKPNYSSIGGLKVYFTRTSVNFDYADTTQTPGFEAAFHDVLPLGAAIEWLTVKQPNSPTLGLLIQKYERKRADIKDFYLNRYLDNLPNKINTKEHNFA